MSYVLLNDAYVADGYTEAGYVGTEADLLYFELGYIGNLLQGTATISVVSSISAVAQERDYASGSISIASALSASGTGIRPGTSSLSLSSSFAGGARRIRTSSAEPASSAAAEASAARTRSSTVSITGVFDPTVVGVARRVGEISVGSTSSVSVSAIRVRSGSSSIVDAGNETTWSDAGAWYRPKQGTWARRVRVRGSAVFRNNTVSVSISSSVAADAFRRRGAADIVIPGVGQLSANGGVLKPFSATLNITSSIPPVSSETLTVGSATLTVQGTVSSRGISKFTSGAVLPIVGSVSVQGTRRKTFSASVSIEGSALADAVKIARSSADLLAATTVLSTSIRYQRGTVIAAANSQIAAIPGRRRPGVSEQNIVGSISINGGKLLGIANEVLAGEFQISRALGRFINIDPYRTIDVEPELRTRKILSETRIIPVDLETGVNSVRAENRVIKVPAESRYWLIDVGTLTTVSLDPIDRERV